MENKKLSLGDIAKRLKLSKTTVSFVLNGKAREKRISDDVVARINSLVDKVGYRPNLVAKSLRTGKSKIIGLMVEDISNPFFASVARLIEENAYKSGYKIFYCSTDSDTEKTLELLSMFRERNIDGYIISPPNGIEDELMSLQNKGHHVVQFDRFLEGAPTDYVVINNQDSAFRATQHFIQQGFKEIAFVTVDSHQSQMKDRFRGYDDALKKHGLKGNVKALNFNQDPEITINEISQFLGENPAIDAILFGTHYLAIHGLDAMKRSLVSFDHYGIISFDDHDLFRLITPTITAIVQPIHTIAEIAITTLLSKLDGEVNMAPAGRQRLVLPTNLLIRDSSLKKRK